MEFGKHIDKGLWAFADKALPAVYGVGFIFLVVRVLPEEEYGAYVIIQSIFLIVSAMGSSLALQPLTKFAAETSENGSFIVASLVLIIGFFAGISLIIFLLKASLASLLDLSNRGNIEALCNYIPLLLFTTLYRNFAVSLLQAEYKVQEIFLIDAVYFLGTLILIYATEKIHRFNSAEDIVKLNALGLALSSGLAIVMTYPQMRVKFEMRLEAFKKMLDFGKYSLGSNANYLIYSQMDVFLVSSYGGVVALAQYSAAKIITRLFDIISQVSQMFIIPLTSRYFAMGEKKTIAVILEKSISFSLLLFFPVFVVVLLFPHFILDLLYAGKYDSTANIFQAIGCMALIVPWTSVFAAALVGIGRVRSGFILGILITALSFGLSWLLIRIGGAFGVAVALVITNMLSIFGLLYLIRQDVDIKIMNVFIRVRDVWVFVREYFPASARK